MRKIDKRVIAKSAACTPQQVYMLGTFQPDGTPLLLSQVSACFIPGPPEGMIVGVMSSEQPKTAENILRGQAFSLNLCNTAMRKLADAAWYERSFGAEGESAAFYPGGALNVPILEASPYALECKVLQSVRAGDTIVFISAIARIHADSRFTRPYPESGDYYDWYASQDAKNFEHLPYAFNYYTLSESAGRIGIEF